MSNLSGQVAIVTGASSGIGQATALELAKRSVKVVLAARRSDRLKDTARQITDLGETALPVPCDVAQRDHVQNVVEKTMQSFGRIDILINNAAIMANAPMIRTRIDDWSDMVDINIKGVLYGIGFALPIMLKQKSGHIVNVSSVAGRKIFAGGAVYCGTKHAVHAISEGLRTELAEQAQRDRSQIRVTVIAPGVVMTELPDSIRDPEHRELSKKYYNGIAGPLSSEDVAASILFALESPAHMGVNEIVVRPVAQIG